MRRNSWFMSPRTSARWRALGRKCSFSPSWIAPGSPACSSADACASDSIAFARPLERRVDVCRADAARGGFGQPRVRLFECALDGIVHATTIRAPTGWRRRARLRPSCGADRAASGSAPRRLAPARLRPREGEVRHRVFATCRTSSAASSSSSTTRVCCRRGCRWSGRAARCSCSSRSGTACGRGSPGRRDGCGPGAATATSSCSSTSARADGACASTGEPAGETPLPPYIIEPLADPERYQTVYARDAGLGGSADGRPALHAGAARGARRRACDAARRPGHVPAGERGTARRARVARRAVRSSARGVGSDRGRRARPRRRHDERARARDGRARRAARGAYDAVRHAGLRVPARRRAADELPPAALDSARARDGVRRRRARRGACTSWRSPSATASTRSAMPC